MLRAIRLFSLLLLGTGITGHSTQAVAQGLNPTGLEVWDSTNQVLFFGDGSLAHLVRAYVDVNQRGADIDIFKDFPGLQEAYVDSFTAGPDGTTLIAATLNFGNRNLRATILSYGSSGQLLKTWEPAPQYADVIAYSKDDDAVFALGERDVSDDPKAPDYPLLIEYSRDGRVLKNMIPASTLKNRGESLHQGPEVGQPALRVTKDRIYFYAPTNREVVVCDRNGTVIAHRSIIDIVDEFSTEGGYHLVQTHHVDFTDDGDIVLELLLANDNSGSWGLEVVRVNINTAEAVPVRKFVKNSPALWFVGIKDGQYLYLANGKNLYLQSSVGEEPVPLETKQIGR